MFISNATDGLLDFVSDVPDGGGISDNSDFTSVLKEYLTDPEVVFSYYHPKPKDVVWFDVVWLLSLSE